MSEDLLVVRVQESHNFLCITHEMVHLTMVNVHKYLLIKSLVYFMNMYVKNMDVFVASTDVSEKAWVAYDYLVSQAILCQSACTCTFMPITANHACTVTIPCRRHHIIINAHGVHVYILAFLKCVHRQLKQIETDFVLTISISRLAS